VARVTASTATATALTTTGRIGVNTTTPGADLEVNGMVKIGNVNIIPLYLFTTHTFTNAGATGRTGPTLSAIRSAYSGVSWAQNNSYLSMTGDNGIQLWTVPVTGIYTIRAKGAAGFIGPGLSNARGIDIQTTTTLIKGEVIKILVGQRGSWHGGWTYLGGGGGGSFVVRENSTPIIIAGGGGGTGGRTHLIIGYINSDATRETYGMDGAENPSSGGTNGGGGKGGQGSGGGGFLQDGFAGINNNILPSSFLTGGGGGGGGAGAGGFGGGGYTQDITGSEAGGGGGGGYSGGGGGNDYNPGGGGGSYAISTMTVNGYNTDHGSVTITLTTPSVALDVNGVAVVNGSSATAPALTTVGRIGVNTATPTVALDVSGVARMVALSATSTALTTVGRIGVNTTTPAGALDVTGATYLNSGSGSGSVALWTLGRVGVNNTAPGFDLDVNGRACVTASSATATALTTTGRIGVNTTAPETSLHVVGDNTEQSITYIGETALYNFTSHTFSSPVNGRFGPTITQVRLTYSSAIWAQNDIYLTMNSNRQGIQLWTVPATGIYTITAQGASGSDGAPWDTPLAGYGKRIRITTTLIRGEQIQILVGQVSGENNTYGGGGGGGSFVVRGNTPIIIAGGGGGGDYGNAYGDWDKGSFNTSGNSGGGTGGGAGGINGNGGNGSNANASGGGGFFTGGLGGASNTRGKSFIDGGAGGENAGSPGGFGGGSGFSGGYGTGGPGGGGYSGGGGGGEYNTGGGGGSYGISTITDLGYGGRYDAGYVDVVFVSSSQNDTKKVSAIFENGFVAASDGYVLRSDQRIKMNIITNNPTDNLAIIRQLRTVKHKYIDKINYNSDDYKYGFIAQEIHKVIPEAIIKRSDIIPSIYNKANIINTLDNKHILTFEEPLTNIDQFNGDIKLKCYNEQNEVIWIKIKEVIDEYNLEIEGDIHNKELFVYGHIVDDFLFIDKDTIWTVATAALQEVDRQQQADKARIVELEATVASQQSLIHDILERLNNNGL
jgi:hypothetical protein